MLADRNMPFRVAGCLGPLDDDGRPGEGEAAPAEADRAVRLAEHAARQALHHARLPENAEGRSIGVVVGTACGANSALELPGFEANWAAGDPAGCPVDAFVHYDHSALASGLSRRFRFSGPSYVVGTACSSGNHAIGEAADLIRSGQADIVLCGGSDAFTLMPALGFSAMKSLADGECRPFDRHRQGMVLGEGAAMLVLESEASARLRAVRALADVSGWALNCDAVKFAAPLETGERCEQLIHACLRDASLELDDIDYISLHGTGTSTNDLMEARGIARTYGDRTRRVPVSSIKGALGHTLGAAGALEAVASTLALTHDRIPPNTPVMELDEGIDLNVVTKSTGKPLRHILSLSFAFGGCNVATVLSKPLGSS